MSDERSTDAHIASTAAMTGLSTDEVRERLARMGAEAPRPPTARPTWNETVNNKPRRQRREPSVEPASSGKLPMEGGFAKVPNEFVIHLMDVMSAPLLKAYLLACQLANIEGKFFVGEEAIAERIGARGRNRRTYAGSVMERLIEAGLLKRIKAGNTGSATTYQLVSLAKLNVRRAREILALPVKGGSHRRKLVA
jgi:hypothetical protein